MESIFHTMLFGEEGMLRVCPVCGSEYVDLWLGGQGLGTAKAWITSAARAWYHCRDCNYLGVSARIQVRVSTWETRFEPPIHWTP